MKLTQVRLSAIALAALLAASGGRAVLRQWRRAMKTFITALVLVFVLASGASMMALPGHGYTHLAQNGAHAAGNQQAALLY
jgi:hypothetical protein